jgi:transposase
MRVPQCNSREWRQIEAVLPKHRAAGRPRQNDRLFVSAILYAAACSCSLESLPSGYPPASSLRTRRLTWQRDGTLERVMMTGKPAIARMYDEYIQRLRAHSDDTKNWGKPIFGTGVIPKLPHAQPRGRYAGRQRQVPEG